MEVLRKTTSVIAILMLCATYSNATWKTVADSQVAIQTTTPTALNTSLTSSFSGGGARVQWSSLGNVTLINATPPKFAAGCNGIEIGFGSISFLDFDNLVAKLKMIASAAPAFAFKMAIDTVCSQCSTIMQDIEQIVEAINNFSLDACAISENLGNSIGGALADSANSRYDDSYKAQKEYNNDKSSYNKNAIADTINGWSDTLNGKSIKLEKVKAYGSFLNNLRVNKIPNLNAYTPKNYIDLLRTLTGDVVGYIDKKNGYEDKYTYIPPSRSIDDLLDLLVGNKYGNFPMTMVSLGDNDSTWNSLDLNDLPTGALVTYDTTGFVTQENATSSAYKSWTQNIQDSITIIVNKFKTDAVITSSDLAYLQNLPFNGYKILNYFAMVGTDTTSQTVKDYSKYIAIMNAKVQLTILLDFAETSLVEYITDTQRISSKNKNIEFYQDVLSAVKAQKLLLSQNEDIKNVNNYVSKVKELLNKDMKLNRIERLQ